MNEVPSSQFRLVFGKLREPTVVTVNGHPIGEWTPRLGTAPEHREAVFDLQGYPAEALPDADKVRDLQEEVVRLKRELAARPQSIDKATAGVFVQPDLGSQTLIGTARRERQKTIDETLARVNRTKKGA